MLFPEVAFECVALIAIAMLCFIRPQCGDALFKSLRPHLRKLHRRPYVAILTIFLTSLLFTSGLSLALGPPTPYSNDELSYLLAAETFASGRLTNPSHPLCDHFECRNNYTIHRPSYQSKYPPFQGMVLALGWLLGHPVIGVCLGMAAASAAVCWMLQGWVPARWALLGGMLTALHPWMAIWWGHSYWGGAGAMLGGALVFGAGVRIVRRPRVASAIAMGVGIAILANSRPFEGLLAVVPVAVVGSWAAIQNLRVDAKELAIKTALPLLGILILSGGWMAYYNQRVTGDPLTLPYQVWHQKYHPAQTFSSFLLGAPHAPLPETNAPIQQAPQSNSTHPSPGVARADAIPSAPVPMHVQLKRKLLRLWAFFPRILLTAPLIALIGGRWNRRMSFAIFSCALVMLALFVQPRNIFPHYFAPVACLFFLLVIEGMRRMRLLQIRVRRAGRFFVRAMVVAYLVACPLFIVCWLPQREQFTQRAKIIEELEARGGYHLVIVQRDFRYPVQLEWTANGAHIDKSAVVWTRTQDGASNRRLLEYFQDRTVWFADQDAGTLQPLTEEKRIELTH